MHDVSCCQANSGGRCSLVDNPDSSLEWGMKDCGSRVTTSEQAKRTR